MWRAATSTSGRRSRNDMARAAVNGKDVRTTALRRTLQASGSISGGVVCLTEWTGPTVEANVGQAIENAAVHRPDFVFVGPEAPLAAGVVDALEQRGIPCI